jgi:hypothetical protein
MTRTDVGYKVYTAPWRNVAYPDKANGYVEREGGGRWRGGRKLAIHSTEYVAIRANSLFCVLATFFCAPTCYINLWGLYFMSCFIYKSTLRFPHKNCLCFSILPCMLCLNLIFEYNIAKTIKLEVSLCLIFNSSFSKLSGQNIFLVFFRKQFQFLITLETRGQFQQAKVESKQKTFCVFVPNYKATRRYQRSLKISYNYV